MTLVVGDITRPDHPLLPLTTIAANSASLTRSEYPDEDPFEHAMRLHEVSGGIILTTDGPNPVHVIDRDGRQFWATPPFVQMVDATGAGDAFKAGVIYGLFKGWELERAVAWGTAAGGLNTRHLGATSHPPRLEEVQEAAKRVSIRSTH